MGEVVEEEGVGMVVYRVMRGRIASSVARWIKTVDK